MEQQFRKGVDRGLTSSDAPTANLYEVNGMTQFNKTRRFAVAAGLCGVAMLTGATLAQSAGAVASPGVSFYTGFSQNGTQEAADLTGSACKTLQQGALSAANLTGVDVAVYFNPDCRNGAPGTGGSLFYVLGSLQTANFPYKAVSYRVLGN
jgi:hypothetical protein